MNYSEYASNLCSEISQVLFSPRSESQSYEEQTNPPHVESLLEQIFERLLYPQDPVLEEADYLAWIIKVFVDFISALSSHQLEIIARDFVLPLAGRLHWVMQSGYPIKTFDLLPVERTDPICVKLIQNRMETIKPCLESIQENIPNEYMPTLFVSMLLNQISIFLHGRETSDAIRQVHDQMDRIQINFQLAMNLQKLSTDLISDLYFNLCRWPNPSENTSVEGSVRIESTHRQLIATELTRVRQKWHLVHKLSIKRYLEEELQSIPALTSKNNESCKKLDALKIWVVQVLLSQEVLTNLQFLYLHSPLDIINLLQMIGLADGHVERRVEEKKLIIQLLLSSLSTAPKTEEYLFDFLCMVYFYDGGLPAISAVLVEYLLNQDLPSHCNELRVNDLEKIIAQYNDVPMLVALCLAQANMLSRATSQTKENFIYIHLESVQKKKWFHHILQKHSNRSETLFDLWITLLTDETSWIMGGEGNQEVIPYGFYLGFTSLALYFCGKNRESIERLAEVFIVLKQRLNQLQKTTSLSAILPKSVPGVQEKLFLLNQGITNRIQDIKVFVRHYVGALEFDRFLLIRDCSPTSTLLFLEILCFGTRLSQVFNATLYSSKERPKNVIDSNFGPNNVSDLSDRLAKFMSSKGARKEIDSSQKKYFVTENSEKEYSELVILLCSLLVLVCKESPDKLLLPQAHAWRNFTFELLRAVLLNRESDLAVYLSQTIVECELVNQFISEKYHAELLGLLVAHKQRDNVDDKIAAELIKSSSKKKTKKKAKALEFDPIEGEVTHYFTEGGVGVNSPEVEMVPVDSTLSFLDLVPDLGVPKEEQESEDSDVGLEDDFLVVSSGRVSGLSSKDLVRVTPVVGDSLSVESSVLKPSSEKKSIQNIRRIRVHFEGVLNQYRKDVISELPEGFRSAIQTMQIFHAKLLVCLAEAIPSPGVAVPQKNYTLLTDDEKKTLETNWNRELTHFWSYISKEIQEYSKSDAENDCEREKPQAILAIEALFIAEKTTLSACFYKNLELYFDPELLHWFKTDIFKDFGEFEISFFGSHFFRPELAADYDFLLCYQGTPKAAGVLSTDINQLIKKLMARHEGIAPIHADKELLSYAVEIDYPPAHQVSPDNPNRKMKLDLNFMLQQPTVVEIKNPNWFLNQKLLKLNKSQLSVCAVSWGLFTGLAVMSLLVANALCAPKKPVLKMLNHLSSDEELVQFSGYFFKNVLKYDDVRYCPNSKALILDYLKPLTRFSTSLKKEKGYPTVRREEEHYAEMERRYKVNLNGRIVAEALFYLLNRLNQRPKQMIKSIVEEELLQVLCPFPTGWYKKSASYFDQHFNREAWQFPCSSLDILFVVMFLLGSRYHSILLPTNKRFSLTSEQWLTGVKEWIAFYPEGKQRTVLAILGRLPESELEMYARSLLYHQSEKNRENSLEMGMIDEIRALVLQLWHPANEVDKEMVKQLDAECAAPAPSAARAALSFFPSASAVSADPSDISGLRL